MTYISCLLQFKARLRPIKNNQTRSDLRLSVYNCLVTYNERLLKKSRKFFSPVHVATGTCSPRALSDWLIPSRIANGETPTSPRRPTIEGTGGPFPERDDIAGGQCQQQCIDTESEASFHIGVDVRDGRVGSR